MPRTELSVETAAGPALVELTRPSSARALVLLTHGAGVGVQTVDVLAARDALVTLDVAVGLVTQPYRVAGRGAPPAPARQDPAWLETVAAVRRRRGLRALPLVLGGRSNGARVACRTATVLGARGVVALAFPLHPPGRREKTRIDELDGAGVPVLVVQGDRDPFGMPPPGPAREIVVVARGDHSLRQDPSLVAAVVGAFVSSIIEHARVQK